MVAVVVFPLKGVPRTWCAMGRRWAPGNKMSPREPQIPAQVGLRARSSSAALLLKLGLVGLTLWAARREMGAAKRERRGFAQSWG